MVGGGAFAVVLVWPFWVGGCCWSGMVDVESMLEGKLEFLEFVGGWRAKALSTPLSVVIHPTYAVTYINTIGRHEDLK